jgi:hypothetical protein
MTIVSQIKERNMTKTCFQYAGLGGAAMQDGALPFPSFTGPFLGDAIPWANGQCKEGRRQAEARYQ